jgi:hypothetical protein
MEYKGQEILEINYGLNYLSGKEIDFDCAYSVIKDIENIKKFVIAFEEVKKKIFSKYPLKDAAGNEVDVNERNNKITVEYISFLDSQKEDIELNTKMILDDLKKLEKIKPADLGLLMKYFLKE